MWQKIRSNIASFNLIHFIKLVKLLISAPLRCNDPLSFESNKKIDANKGKLSYRKVLNCIYYKLMAFIIQFFFSLLSNYLHLQLWAQLKK